jgi:hypothetical protein
MADNNETVSNKGFWPEHHVGNDESSSRTRYMMADRVIEIRELELKIEALNKRNEHLQKLLDQKELNSKT